jgi:hypothetical protein
LIPWAHCEKPERRRLLVRRFRCKACGKTRTYLPSIALHLKRYAAKVVQGCWEDWARIEETTGAGLCYEATAEAWHVPSARTVKGWLGPLIAKADALMGEIRRYAREVSPGRALTEGQDVQAPQSPAGTARSPQRYGLSKLLNLTRTLLAQVTLSPEDQLRVPYHFVMLVARNT